MQTTEAKTKPNFDWIKPLFMHTWPFFAGLAFIFLFTREPDIAEKGYSTAVFPMISSFTGWIGTFLQASMAELLFISGLLFTVVMGLFTAARAYNAKKKDRKKILTDAGLMVLRVASFIYLGFAITCAPNYHRQPFSYYSGHVVEPATVAELTELTAILGRRADELRPQVQQTENGQVILTGNTVYEVSRESKVVMAGLAETYPILEGSTPQPKPVSTSFFMSKLGLSGFYFSFLNEPNFNTHMPAVEIPFTMLHELSHAHGFMREDEANFIAYLACRDADNPDFAYSGNFMALRYCLNALARADYDAYVAVYESLSEPVRRDLGQVSAYWREQDGSLTRVSNTVNDTYLKANSQQSGVASYGMVVDLLLAEYRTWPEATT